MVRVGRVELFPGETLEDIRFSEDLWDLRTAPDPDAADFEIARLAVHAKLAKEVLSVQVWRCGVTLILLSAARFAIRWRSKHTCTLPASAKCRLSGLALESL